MEHSANSETPIIYQGNLRLMEQLESLIVPVAIIPSYPAFE
jgi:hypothetical protein